MVYYRLSNKTASNHYAFPLPVQPVLSADTFELLDIGWTPIYGGDRTETIESLPPGTWPWEEMSACEYDHDLQQAAGLAIRSTTKPYQVVQPKGASLTLKGRVVNWEKVSITLCTLFPLDSRLKLLRSCPVCLQWSFHVGFT
jgi:primary-amine oxidase